MSSFGESVDQFQRVDEPDQGRQTNISRLRLKHAAVKYKYSKTLTETSVFVDETGGGTICDRRLGRERPRGRAALVDGWDGTHSWHRALTGTLRRVDVFTYL